MTVTIPQKIRVLMPDHSVREMDLEEYVRGVLSAAMPADTPLAALQAQAVAARTFSAITQRHTERKADVCTVRHCQVWVESVSAAVTRAANETRGQVLTYEDKLIHAFYFEHCDGHTREARGILIEPALYCKSVSCPCGFATLRGHGIGMCQRGASQMARNGDTYEKILKHYYTDVALVEGVGVAHRPGSASHSQHPTPNVPVPVVQRPTSNVQPPTSNVQPPTSNIHPPAPPQPIINAPLPTPPSAKTEEPKPTAPRETNIVTPAREVAIPPDVLKKFARSRPAPKTPPPPVTPPANEFAAPPTDLPEPFEFTPVAPPDSMPEEMLEGLPEMGMPEDVASIPAAEANANLIVDYLPGARMLAGDLREKGVVVTVYDEQANVYATVSGEAPQYGEGGFEIALPHEGEYRVELRGDALTLRVGDETVFVTLADSR